MISDKNIAVRYPILFANQQTHHKLISEQNYKPHSHKSFYSNGQRIVIYSNRKVFISSKFFGTQSYIGTFDDSKFYFNDSSENELMYFQNKNASLDGSLFFK